MKATIQNKLSVIIKLPDVNDKTTCVSAYKKQTTYKVSIIQKNH